MLVTEATGTGTKGTIHWKRKSIMSQSGQKHV